jgi:hypothetical protein
MRRAAILCRCGSGRLHARCHGSGVRSALLSALAYVHDLPGLFPSLRPETPAVLGVAERLAAELGEDDGHVPGELIQDVLVLVDPAARERLVDLHEIDAPGNWAQVVADAGDELLLLRCLAAGAIEAEICDRRARPTMQIAQLERMDKLTTSPALLFGAVIPAGSVWSIVEAKSAVDAAVHSTGAGWLEVVEERGGDTVTCAHVARLRKLVSALARQLPIRTLPRASARLADAAERVRTEQRLARETTVMLLVAYAAALEAGKLAPSPN